MPDRKILGWREWLSMPDLGIDRIKAKLDTGARTSALHAVNIEAVTRHGVKYVRFEVHPQQRREDVIVQCEARVVSQRQVTDSGGHRELRYVIESTIRLGDMSWQIEVTLTNRTSMGFRMLLGRTALRKCCLVDPGASYLESLAGGRKRKSKK